MRLAENVNGDMVAREKCNAKELESENMEDSANWYLQIFESNDSLGTSHGFLHIFARQTLSGASPTPASSASTTNENGASNGALS